jgi:hypothetical protein
MPCLSSLLLRKNGIDDSHRDELLALLSNGTITKLDISSNDIPIKTMTALANHIIETPLSHLRWVDLSRNSYSSCR